MANEKTCAYCGTALGPGDEICPSCGAPNPHHVPGGEGGTRKPRTIEELRAFCESKGMPLEKMRFFIGINEPSPRAFGIYRDGDQVRVFGSQEVEGNWVMVNGTVTADPAQQDRFTLSGEVVTRVSYNNHGNACRRTGEFHFVQKPGKKYWRMREIDNPCEAVADYVDIYFK